MIMPYDFRTICVCGSSCCCQRGSKFGSLNTEGVKVQTNATDLIIGLANSIIAIFVAWVKWANGTQTQVGIVISWGTSTWNGNYGKIIIGIT